ncbi:hypothetical protein Q1695_009401 [Nippostrongylus brasiliensis]|nr:hypothetical protein Q1695_009401 [Nippostrongylus brasiliensis]
MRTPTVTATITIVLSFILKITVGYGHYWRSSGCQSIVDSNSECFCSGTSNGRSLAGSENRIEDLTTMFENCTRVYGNVEVTHLTKTTLTNWTDADFSKKLKIFEHIEEIKGYLLIYNVDIRSIDFPNLKIIWGDDLLDDNSALTLSSNLELKELRMPRLRAIHKGNVRIENSTFLCYLQSKVNWDELLEDDALNRLITSDSAFRQCNPSLLKCTDCEHCWSGKAKYCQEEYRSVCGGRCSSRQCFQSGNSSEYECCHEACTGGCTGRGANECVACRELSLDGVCVHQCPPMMVHDPKKGMLIPNPSGRYVYDRYCVAECPKELLVERDACVRHCSVGSHHDMTKDSRRCEPCKGICPKVCQVTKVLTGSILRNLSGCEEIDGFIDIQDSKMRSKVDGYTREDLNVLRTVRMISEYVQMATQTVSPRNLSFLENLEFIEGRSLVTSKFALAINKNDNLEQLGLRKLKKIKAGSVIITENHGLCYAQTIKWKTIISENAQALVTKNMDGKCESRGRICDSTCHPEFGCWGRGPTMCTKCRYWKLEDTCVKECPQEGFYQDHTTKQCLPCYSECLTCTGPSERDCLSCRNVQLISDDGIACLSSCGDSHYQDGDECKPCHENCSNLKCTGPGDHLGDGGCTECLYALMSRDHKVVRCLAAPSINEACRDVVGYYPSTQHVDGVQLVHCDPCDEQCAVCTSSGRNSIANGCVCKGYANEMLKDSVCFERCFDSHYVAQPPNGTQPGICRGCHRLCDRGHGCTGPTESDCNRCMFATLAGEPNVCLSDCPEEFPYLDEFKMCHRVDLKKEREKRMKMIAIVLIIIFTILMITMLIVCMRCRTFKRKLLKEQISNYVDIPELAPIDPNARSNMTRVNLITASELQTKGTELGAGAFGVVYAGFWFPKGKGKIKVPVAIKLVKGPCTGKEETEMLNEAMQMSSLRHEHLLRLVGICLHEGGIQLVTLLRPLGNLLNFLKKHKTHLCGKDLLLYCYQISSAMKYLYEHRIIHRDLAARNVLVKRHNHVEVTDFGLAKLLDYGQENVKVKEGKVAIKWLALESLSDQSYTHRTDVWAFGITCWEILTFGQSPYQGMDICSIRSFLRDGNRLSQPSNCSAELYQVLLQCWMANPESRPTFTMLHDRFQSFCRIPHLYVVDQTAPQAFIETESQRDLLRELLNDTENDFTDPLNYFETCENPDTPTSEMEMSFAPRNVRRLQSTSSHRYQTDPMIRPVASARPSELGMDDGNYLIPNAKLLSEQATMYTPVVINDSGATELVNSHDYYNDTKEKPDYYNDVIASQPGDHLLQINEESAEDGDKESCFNFRRRSVLKSIYKEIYKMENRPSTRPYLLWRGENATALYYIDQKNIYTIGRRCTCDIAFSTTNLLPVHATVHRNHRRNRISYSICSCSEGKVAVNDEILQCGRKRDLAFHDVIALLEGSQPIRLTFCSKQGIVDESRPSLTWETKSYIQVRYLEEKKFFTLGSDRTCDVSCPSPHLAGTHAVLSRNISRGTVQFSIKLAFSRRANVFVNGSPVSKKGAKNLTDGDLLTVSTDPKSVQFRFHSGESTTPSAAPSAPSQPVSNSVSQWCLTSAVQVKPENEKREVKESRGTKLVSLTQLEANLTCCVCLNIFFKPINIDPCNHKCCYSCVLSWLQQNGFVGKCPQCRCTIMSIKLDPLLSSIVETLLAMKPGLRRSSEEIAMIEEMEARNMREYQSLLQYSLTVDDFLPEPRTPRVFSSRTVRNRG